MVALSKFVENHVRTKTCQSLLMHSESCSVHCLKDLIPYTVSNFKHFAPICIIPALIKLRTMDREKFRKTLEYYMECSLIGTAVGYSINCLICLFRNLLGHFGFYTFAFLPSAIGGCLINFGSPRVVDMFESSMFQCNIETFFLMRRFFLSRLISNSVLLQTYIFMLCSAVILQGKHLYNIKGFWFLKPNPKVAGTEYQCVNNCELHPKVNCQHFLLDGMRKYFLLGLTLDIVKALMSNVKVGPHDSQLMGKAKAFRIRSTALLTAYIGIYRFTHCILNRHFPAGQSLSHFSSAFLAGICYYFNPQSALLSFALVQAINTIWKIVQIENANTNNSALRFLLRLPFGKLLFPLALGNSVHLVCLKPEYCSRLTEAITNGVANSYPTRIKDEILRMKQQMSEELIKSAIK